MVERIILLVAAVFVGLLFLYAVVIAPQDRDRDRDGVTANKIAQETPKTPPDDEWFQETVINSDIPVLVDFKADWCGPCKLLHPHLVQLEEKYAGRLKVVKVDVDEKREIAKHYEASSIPTILFFVDGVAVDGFIGYREYDEIEEIALKYLTDESADVSTIGTSETPELVLTAN
ncbi:thioredoxin [Thalassoglobus sp.]|uniref:thioredoxin n=1 Tax=Thalassoglobus sp. TaxID=2795869 RepID=UPI003AA91DA8